MSLIEKSQIIKILRKVMSFESEKLSQYNLTKLIKKTYEAGIPLAVDMVNEIDFKEKGNKTFWQLDSDGNNLRYDIKESLALNCVRFLPLSHYKSYIDPTWINTENDDYNMVHTALGARKYEFLTELITVTRGYVKKIFQADKPTVQDQDYLHQYENYFLKPLLNIGHNLTNLTQECAAYYSLFKIGLEDFNNYYNYKAKKNFFIASPHLLTEKNWSENYSQLQHLFPHYEKWDTILKKVLATEGAFDIFMDMNSEKQLISKDNFIAAYKYGNKKVAIYLGEQLIDNREKMATNVFSSALQNWIDRQKNRTNFSQSLGRDFVYLTNLLTILDTLAPEHTFQSFEKLGYLLTQDNPQFIEKVLDKYPALEKKPLLHGYSASEWGHAYQMFSDFIENNNLVVTPSYELFFGKQLSKNLVPQSVLCNNVAVQEMVASYYLPHIQGLSPQEKTATYFAYCMDRDLPQKTDKKVRTKV